MEAKLTPRDGVRDQPLAAVEKRKSASQDVTPNQPATAEIQKGNERSSSWSHNNRSGRSTLDRRSAARLRDWRGKGDSVTAACAKHNNHRQHHHNRDWWRHHCNVIVLVGWGYWGWDAGWWYPAWGYNPAYSAYAFDEPIYGYQDLPPDQVIANVQGALQDLGYYLDEIDGVLGPTTRAALESYQQENGLPVTGLIDPETLQSLGFV
jgi:Putative peptidoglycan binding domain